MTGHRSGPQDSQGTHTGDHDRRLNSDPNVAGHVDDVAAALSLVDEMASFVGEDINQGLREATDAGDFGRARQLLELAERLSSFRTVVEDASKEWSRIAASLARGKRGRRRRSTAGSQSQTARRQKNAAGKRADYGNVSPDQKTSQKEFLLPILEALVDMGGSGTVPDVLQKVEEKMGPTFKRADLEPIPSNSRVLRWRSTAQWARQELVDDGFIGPPRRRGIWEITDGGRAFLRANRSSNR